MSISEAAWHTYRRVIENHPYPLPLVQVRLSWGRVLYLNGLSIAPGGVAPDIRAWSSPGTNSNVFVVRDEDIAMVEIEPAILVEPQ